MRVGVTGAARGCGTGMLAGALMACAAMACSTMACSTMAAAQTGGQEPGHAAEIAVINGTARPVSAAQAVHDAIAVGDSVQGVIKAARGEPSSLTPGARSARGRRRGGESADLAAPVQRGPMIVPGRMVPHGAALDNAQVVMLTRAGLGDAAVAALVQTRPAHYDTSTGALIGLRRAGVGSGVIAAMITAQVAADATRVEPDSTDPTQPHPPGVYVLADWLDAPRMLAVRPVTSSETRAGGILGYAIAGGMIPVSYRAVVPGAHAPLVAGKARPTFYFYASDGAAGAWGAAPDPGTIALVRFAGTKNGREVGIGTVSFSGARTGVRAKDALPFGTREVAPGVIAVRPESDLPPGEYGFVQTAAGVGAGPAQVATTATRVFDFAVGDGIAAAAADHRRAAHDKGDAGFTRVAGVGDVDNAALPVALDYLDRVAGTVPKRPTLTKAEKAASSPSNYPGGGK